MGDQNKAFLKSILGLSQLLPFRLLSTAIDRQLLAPFYHAVSDQPLPHIRHLYQVKTVQEFERDLDFLLKYYMPIDVPDLANYLDSQPFHKGKKPMLLSFDDGLREFYDLIAPVLMRKGIPAICFLNSGFLDNTDLFFRYKASLLMEAIPANQDIQLREKIRSIAYSDRAQLDGIASQIGVDFSAFLREYKPYLTSEQVENLIKKGFYFGAHSVDHPMYQHLSLEEQLRQTTRSIETISNKFGLGYRLFSFPFTDFGVSKRFFDVVLEEKKIADYSFGCAGLKTDVHPRHLQRIPMEKGHLTAEEILRQEFLYFWVKWPFGKNRIQRT